MKTKFIYLSMFIFCSFLFACDNGNEIPEKNDLEIKLKVGESEFRAILYENLTTESFIKMLPMTISMSDLNRNEKYYYLSDLLPTASMNPNKIQTGDIMLYGSNCLVLFYEDFSTSYSYTRIGFIHDVLGFKEALGAGNVVITFSQVT